MIGNIVPLMLQFPQLITHHMVIFHENSTKSFPTCICAHNAIFVWICNLQNWCTSDKISQLLKTSLTFPGPFKLISPFMQRSYWVCNLRESLNEYLIITSKTHGKCHIYHIPWSRLIPYIIDLFKGYSVL